jgi:alkylated DNA repair dioxygenase AlkB
VTVQESFGFEHSVRTLPIGATYLPDFISTFDEASLLKSVDASPWMAELQRRVQHYGWKYDYRRRRVSSDEYLGPLPEWVRPTVDRINSRFRWTADQVIVNEYTPGQGIAAHADCKPCFGPAVAMLSLGSSAEMDFRHPDGRTADVLLEPRSLLVLTGAARFDWTHAIPKRRNDGKYGLVRARRVSLTFRTVIVEGEATGAGGTRREAGARSA